MLHPQMCVHDKDSGKHTYSESVMLMSWFLSDTMATQIMQIKYSPYLYVWFSWPVVCVSVCLSPPSPLQRHLAQEPHQKSISFQYHFHRPLSCSSSHYLRRSCSVALVWLERRRRRHVFPRPECLLELTTWRSPNTMLAFIDASVAAHGLKALILQVFQRSVRLLGS